MLIYAGSQWSPHPFSCGVPSGAGAPVLHASSK